MQIPNLRRCVCLILGGWVVWSVVAAARRDARPATSGRADLSSVGIMVPRAVLDDEDELTIYPDTAAVLEIGGAATVNALHEAAVAALTPADSLSLSDSEDGLETGRPIDEPGDSAPGSVRNLLGRVWRRGRDVFVFAAVLVFVTVLAVVGYVTYLLVREHRRMIRRVRGGPAWTRLRNQRT